VRLLLCSLALLGTAVCQAGRERPLEEPEPVAVPAGVPLAVVEKAILATAQQDQWSVDKQVPGSIELSHAVREVAATIAVTYDASSVRISYVGSQNMVGGSRHGNLLIRYQYNRWVKSFASTVAAQLHDRAQAP
jgi:hypothetical protein